MYTESVLNNTNQTADHFVNPVANAPLFIDDKWSAVWHTLQTNVDLNYTDAREPVSIASRISLATASIYEAITDGWTCSVGFSGGKDSTAVLHLFLMALVRAVRSGTNVSQHHFIQTADTLIENPEMHYHATQMLASLQAFIDAQALPVTIIVSRPSLTQSWVGRVLTGRGLPTYTNSASRLCSNDFKINPMRQAKARYLKGLPESVRGRVCLMLGSRDAEGHQRAGNIARVGGQATHVTRTAHGGELYPVKEWTTQDIWTFLTASGSDARFPLPGFQPDNFVLAELYKDATGECIWSPEKTTSSPSACGARYGCSLCTAVGIDRSMETLINTNPEKYGYQDGLNRLQRYLTKIQYDWSLRDYVGRTTFEGGYIRLQPNVFSSGLTERLFHVCCSLDYAEARRANDVSEKLHSGELPDTPHNRRMSSPQFCLVEEQSVLYIDFLWSLHCYNPEPFRAIAIYRRVWEHGELDLLDDEPDLTAVPRTPMPAPLWLRVPGSQHDTDRDGLTDPLTASTYFEGERDERAARTLATATGKKSIVSFDEEDEVTVDAATASWIIWHEYDGLCQRISSGGLTACYAAHYLLRYGAIRLAKGKGSLYHKLAQRGQRYQRMGLTDNRTLPELLHSQQYKILDDAAYRMLVARRIEGQMKKWRFWCWVALCAELHRYNHTALGNWLRQESQREEQQHAVADAAAIKLRLMDAILTYSNLRLQREGSIHQPPADRRYFRLMRKLSLTTVMQCLQAGSEVAFTETLWDLRLLTQAGRSNRTGFRNVDAHPEALSGLLKPLLKRLIHLHHARKSER